MSKGSARSGKRDSPGGQVVSTVHQWAAARARKMGLTCWRGRERDQSAGSRRNTADRTHKLEGSRARSISRQLQEHGRQDSQTGQVASVVDQREAAGARQTGLTSWTGSKRGRSARSCRSKADRIHVLDRLRAWSISRKLQERGRQDSLTGWVASAVDQQEAAGDRRTGLTGWRGRKRSRSAGRRRRPADRTHTLEGGMPQETGGQDSQAGGSRAWSISRKPQETGGQDSHTGWVTSAVNQQEVTGARQTGLTYWMGRKHGQSAGSHRSKADRTHKLDGSQARAISRKVQEKGRQDSLTGWVASTVDQQEAAGDRRTGLTGWRGRERRVASAVDQRDATGDRRTGLTGWRGRERSRSVGRRRRPADRTHKLDGSQARSISRKLQEKGRQDSRSGWVTSAVDQQEAAGERQTGLTCWTGRECGRSAGSCRRKADRTHKLDGSQARSISRKLQEKDRQDSRSGWVMSAVDQQETAGERQTGLTCWTGRECGRSAGSCRRKVDRTYILNRLRARSISGKLQERGRWDSHPGWVASMVDQREATGAHWMGLTSWMGCECGRSAGSCRSKADGTHILDGLRVQSISKKLQERGRQDSHPGQVTSGVNQQEAAGDWQMGLTSWTGRERARSGGSCGRSADRTHMSHTLEGS
ncbi:hypothetical protein C8R44DRAFT_742029 [Mycena epipterygia]|nr:hypothetical protein C8R44DRAFT_742029 [Mycena epipterygia]